ncbi:MAG: NAD(P)H-dependent oxidoreductase [Candidatus Bipolaricaulis sp.]|nr:NAD(P)H-dependent oxidoreductase [Candidatus Bipolaricaulis sp.]
MYWWGPSAQLEAFVDRWYGAWHNPAHRAAFAGKRAIVVASMGDSDPATARRVVGMFEDAFTYMGVTLAATVPAPNVSNCFDASKRAHLIDAARAAGRKAVANL